MDYKDYYQVLGVSKSAEEKEIKRAYRRLARQFHPDVNPGDKQAEERFKDINEAYEVLSDPEKRAKYDQFGASWRQYQRAGGDPSGFDWGQWANRGRQGGQWSGAGGPGGVHVEFGDLGDLFSGGGGGFSDFFDTLFGGMGQRTSGFDPRTRARPGMKGQDLEQPVQITLEEAFRGTQRTLEKEGRRLEIKIPQGVKSGSRIRIAGEGLPGSNGMPAGDLYLKVDVLPHSIFSREGDNLHRTLELDLYTALLGGEVNVETLDGNVMMKIPPETQGGRTFRLRGKGMPKLNDGQRGDLYVKVQVRLPEKLNAREKELFQDLARMRR
jgi:curved DNA-binding protein